MAKIEDNTCFIKHSSYSKGESVTLAHFKEVWDNGYSVDDYTIDKEGIYFEDASHNGVDPNQISPGTYIMKKQYLRWVKQMKQSKETAVRMLMKNTSLVNRNLEIGDIILYIWKDYVEEEEYRLDNEYYGMRIVNIKEDSLFAQTIHIGEHSFDSSDTIIRFEDINDIQDNSYFITAETFMAAHDFIRSFCLDLFNEIKSHIKKTEQS